MPAVAVVYELIAKDSASPVFARAGAAAGEAETRIGKLGKAMATAGVVVAGAAAVIADKSIKAATDFQSAMTKISTQAGGTAKDVKVLSDQVLNLAKHTQQGPQALADSLYHLKSVGLDNAKAMAALKQASDLAAVGGANLEDVTNAIAGAWRSGIKGAQSFGAAAATVNAIIGAGNMRMEDFVAAIGTGILPSAKTFGLSLKQVGAALALMTDEGIPAEDAATRLRMTFALMGAPSHAATEALSDIGLKSTTLNNAMRGPGGLIGALTILKQHLHDSGESAAEQAQTIVHAFGGGRSSSAIMTLLNNLDVLRKKQEQVNATTSKFGPAVARQSQTAQAQFDRLKSSLDVLEIHLGTGLLPMVTKFVHFLDATALPDLVKLGKWISSPDVKPWAEIAGKLAAAAVAAELMRKTLVKVASITGLSRVMKPAGASTATPAAAANMNTAAKTMLDASLNMLKAAGIEADAAGTGAAGKAGAAAAGAEAGAAGAAGKAAGAGETVAAGSIGAALARGGLKAAWVLAIEDVIARSIVSSVPQASAAASKQAAKDQAHDPFRFLKGPLETIFGKGVDNLVTQLYKVRDKERSALFGGGGAPRATPRPGLGVPAAAGARGGHFTPVPSHFAPGPGITIPTPRVPSHFAPHPGQGAVLTAAQKTDLKFLEQVYGVDLPRAYKLASAAGDSLATKWNSQDKVAANARSRVAALTAALHLMHGGQKQATADASDYTSALRLNGVASVTTIKARQAYITDLENAHVPAATAVRLANQLATGINTLGNNLAATHPSRKTLVSDLTAAGVHAGTARSLVSKYTNAVRNNGAGSDAARTARKKLITDLENAGLSADQARKLVNNYIKRINAIPAGKTTHIRAFGSGSGKITFAEQNIRNAQTGLVEFHAAGGAIRGRGTGTSDSNLIAASAGEWVIRETSASKYGPAAMKAVNEGRAVIRYATGGLVGADSPVSRLEPAVSSAWATDMKAMLTKGVRDMEAYYRKLAAAQAAASGALGGGAAQNMALARRLMPAWASGPQWSAWKALWTRESGWDRFAENPTSGAYGIPQALPPTKMPFAAQKAGGSHGGPQIDWGASYISGRYGTPAAAEAHELAQGWYAKGGKVKLTAKQKAHRKQEALIALGEHLLHTLGPADRDAQAKAAIAARNRDRLLAKARGLPAGTRRHYKALAETQNRRAAGLNHELAGLRAYRKHLESLDSADSKTMAAAKHAHLTREAARLAKAISARKKTIGDINMRTVGHRVLASKSAPAAASTITPPALSDMADLASALSVGWYGYGGRFAAGQLIGVGDRGPELAVFDQPGRILSPEQSAAATSGGGQFTGTLVLDSGQFIGLVRGEIIQRERGIARATKAGTGQG